MGKDKVLKKLVKYLEKKKKKSRKKHRRRHTSSNSESSDSPRRSRSRTPGRLTRGAREHSRVRSRSPVWGPASRSPSNSSVVILDEDDTKENLNGERDVRRQEALGTEYEDGSVKYEGEIDNDLTKRLQHIIVNGVPKDERTEISKKYKIPNNCTLLDAPTLNPEIKSILTESSKQRDQGIEISQRQVGLATAIVAKTISSLLEEGDIDKYKIIRELTDAAKLLSDVNYHQSKTRTKLITPSLNKNFGMVVNKTKRDALLYGENLGELIKNTKQLQQTVATINKTSSKTTDTKKPTYGKQERPTTNTQTEEQCSWWAEPENIHGSTADPTVPVSTLRQGVSSPAQAMECTSETLTDQNETSAEPDTYPGCSTLLRQALQQSSLEIMLSSLSTGTLKQYNTTYKAWWSFCKKHSLSVFTASVPQVIQFLTQKFEANASYSTLNTDRSALSTLISSKIGSDDRIARFLRGVYRLRPALPRYSESWEPSIVLDYLSSWSDNKELNLEKLTKKLAILLALVSAQRIQTLSVIKIQNINVTSKNITISITDIIKTSIITKSQPKIYLPFYTQNPKICPAKTLKDYLTVTSPIRNSESYLFLCFKKPYKKATSQTIGRWIKVVMQESGIDTTKFSSHSTRHTATSSANRAGINVDAIRKAAGWSNKSNTFAKYYNLPIVETTPEESFALAVLNG